MTPSRSKVSPKPTKAFDRKSLTPSKKPTSGPNVVNKLTAGSSSKMDTKAMLDKMTRKGSGVSPKPTSGPNVANKLTAGSSSKMDTKAMLDKIKRKGSGSAATTPSVPAMKKGGMCKTKKYARGGGIEVRGKTKGKLI